MTPNQMVDRIKAMLDDEEPNLHKVGESYSPREIATQLDASTNSVVQVLFEQNLLHRLQRIISFRSITVTSDVFQTNLPTDYLYAVRATVGRDLARLYVGGIGAIYETPDHYGVMVEGSDLIIKGGNGKEAFFWYVKKPTSWTTNMSTNRTEFERNVYYAIAYHAAGVLAVKNEGSNDSRLQTRFLTYYKMFMNRLSEPPAMIMAFEEYVP